MDPAAPDWINQVRRFPSKHGQDEIVIKPRDDRGSGGQENAREDKRTSAEDRLERGDGERGDSETAVAAGESASGSGSPVETARADEIGDEIEEQDVTSSRTDLGEGDRQWREGRDLIVEHQAHDCDEVRDSSLRS